MPSDFSDVLVHVGYHKAGSTLLQRRLFVPERGIYSRWHQSFYHRTILLDRPDRGWATRTRESFQPGIAEAREAGVRPVLSCEALSGDMWRAGQSNGYGNFHVARLLAEAFPGSQIALVHREQTDMICSLYKHSIRSHWRWSLEAFLDQTPHERGSAPVFNLGYLEYSWLLAEYRQLFGPERVHAFPYELLADPSSWAHKWSTALGMEVRPEWFKGRVNPGLSAVTVHGKRRLNYLIRASAEPNRSWTGLLVNRVSHKLDQRVPWTVRERSDQQLRRRVREIVGDHYADDNRRLMAELGQDWSQWGYRWLRSDG